MKQKVFSISLARGGSKGIPRKNVINIAGKPLIAYTIDAAKNAGVFDRVFVNTDDKEIAEVAKKYGAEVPFLRPDKFALSDTKVLDVLVHFAKWLKEEGDVPDYLVLLQTTAPLRNMRHAREATELLIRSGADSVIGVNEVSGNTHPLWTFEQDRDEYLKIWGGGAVRDIIPLRQQLPRALRTNGSIFGFRTALLYEEKPTFYGNTVVGYIMDKKYSVDIDDPSDLLDVEKKINVLRAEGEKI